MKLALCLLSCLLASFNFTDIALAAPRSDGPVRRLPVTEFRDKMKGAWIGQMIGVGWGMPTEFKIKGGIIPEAKIPAWTPDMVNSTIPMNATWR